MSGASRDYRGLRVAGDVPAFTPDGDLLCPGCGRIVRYQKAEAALWAGCQCGIFAPLSLLSSDPEAERHCRDGSMELLAPCVRCSMLVRTARVAEAKTLGDGGGGDPRTAGDMIAELAMRRELSITEPGVFRTEERDGHRHLVCVQRPLPPEPHSVAEFILRARAGWELRGRPGTLVTMNIPPQPKQEGEGMAVICEEGSVKCGRGHAKSAYGNDYRRVERKWRKNPLPDKTVGEITDLNVRVITLNPALAPVDMSEAWEDVSAAARDVALTCAEMFTEVHRPSCLDYVSERLAADMKSLAGWVNRLEAARKASDLERWAAEWEDKPPILGGSCLCDPWAATARR